MVLKPHQIGQTRYVYYSTDKQFVTYKDEIETENFRREMYQNARQQQNVDAQLSAASGFDTTNPKSKAPEEMIRKPVTTLDFPIFLLDLVLVGYNITLPILALGVDYFAHTLYKPIEPVSKNAEFKPELTRADVEYLNAKRKGTQQKNNPKKDGKQKANQEQVMF